MGLVVSESALRSPYCSRARSEGCAEEVLCPHRGGVGGFGVGPKSHGGGGGGCRRRGDDDDENPWQLMWWWWWLLLFLHI